MVNKYGAVLTYDIGERRDIDVSKEIASISPDENPFAVLLLRTQSQPTNSAEFHWYDDEPGAWWTKVNHAGGYAADATSIVVDDGSIFVAGELIKAFPSMEVMRVTAVSTNTLTVIRGYGTTAAATLDDDDSLLNLSTAMPESSDVPQTKSHQPSKEYNYTQIFRTPVDGSATSDSEGLKTNMSERNRLRREASLQHRLGMDRAFVFGERKESDSSSSVIRTTGGIVSFIKTNVFDLNNNVLDEATFDNEILAQAFKYGSKQKLLIASTEMVGSVNEWAKGGLQTSSGESTYGLSISKYICAHGTLLIASSQLFTNAAAGMGLIVDIKNIKYRPLRKTILRTNIQPNTYDGWMDEYLTEAGLMVRLEKTHTFIKGMKVA